MGIQVQEERSLTAPVAHPGGRRGRPSRRAVAIAATLALAAAFTYLAVRGVDWHRAWVAVEHCDAWWLLPALAVFVLQVLLRAMRWRSLFAHGRRPGRGPIVEATMIGYLFNSIMPARAGEAARVVSLTKNSAVPPAEIVGTALVERVYDLVAVLVIFLAASPWLPHVSWFGAAEILAAAAAIALAGTVAVLAIYGDRPLQWLARPLGRLPRLSPESIERHVALLADGLSGLRHHRVALEATIWTLVAWMASSLWAWLVLLAFFPHITFAAGILVTIATGLAMVIPAPPASLGVFEYACVLALKAYGISQTGALPYAVVLHISNFLPLVLAGAVALHIGTRRAARPAQAATYT